MIKEEHVEWMAMVLGVCSLLFVLFLIIVGGGGQLLGFIERKREQRKYRRLAEKQQQYRYDPEVYRQAVRRTPEPEAYKPRRALIEEEK